MENKDVHDGSVNCISNAALPFAPGLNCAPTIEAISTYALRYVDPWSQDTDHWSVYGLVEWQFIDNWTVIFEGRYADEEVTVTGPDRRDPDGAGPCVHCPGLSMRAA